MAKKSATKSAPRKAAKKTTKKAGKASGGGAAAKKTTKKSSAKNGAAKKSSTKGGRKAHKRELIEPHAGDKRYVRRDDEGKFNESDDVGRSLAQDRRKKAKHVVKAGQGDRGDQQR